MEFEDTLIDKYSKLVMPYLVDENNDFSTLRKTTNDILNIAYSIGCDFSEETIKIVVFHYFKNKQHQSSNK